MEGSGGNAVVLSGKKLIPFESGMEGHFTPYEALENSEPEAPSQEGSGNQTNSSPDENQSS